jgi:hypothetical protein
MFLLAPITGWTSNFDHAHPVWNQLVQRHVIDTADSLPLRTEAYVDADAARLCVTPLLDWYGVDFGGHQGARAWLSEQAEWLDLSAEQARSVANGTLKIGFTDYDWALNDIHTAQERAVFHSSANDNATP